jgi:rsbT co-antagonist protein RsbR
MAKQDAGMLSDILAEHEGEITTEWLDLLHKAGALHTGRIKQAELQTQCRTFLGLLRTAVEKGRESASHSAYDPVREMIAELARSRAMQGFSPIETSTFIFSLKQPLFNAVGRIKGANAASVAQAIWSVTLLLDELGLHAMEVFQKTREEVIARQQTELAELSTPVVKLWKGILAVPLIGTLDSHRTQIVMERLLEAVVDEEAEIAIIDITGVPTVDTLTAQHLLKTVAAARLMGADCIISGIRPQIAQTIVHLGVELNVVSKATLADALAVALRRIGRTVVPTRAAGERAGARE